MCKYEELKKNVFYKIFEKGTDVFFVFCNNGGTLTDVNIPYLRAINGDVYYCPRINGSLNNIYNKGLATYYITLSEKEMGDYMHLFKPYQEQYKNHITYEIY